MKHHISEELLEDYARGQLSSGWSLGVATHLALCPACRNRVRSFEAVGGALLDEIAPASIGNSSFEDILTKISGTGDDTKNAIPTFPSGSAKGTAPVLPQPLRQMVGVEIDRLKWRNLNGDVSQFIFETDDKTTTCRLLRVKAGRPVAEHGHGGRELTLVLAGSFSDEFGTFERGDVELTDQHDEHKPVAGPEEDCICLAITDAALRFRNPVVRMLQPFFRI